MIGVRVLFAGSEAVMELVVRFGLVEREIGGVHNPDLLVVKSISVIALTSWKIYEAINDRHKRLIERAVNTARKTDETTVLGTAVALVRPIAVSVKNADEHACEISVR